MSSARPYKRKPKSKKRKKVSFKTDSTGFKYSQPEEEALPDSEPVTPIPSSFSGKDPWRSFGALSHSEYSFMSDRSSFAASLNTISETNNRWFMDEAQEEDEKLDKMPSNDPAFAFGGTKGMRSLSISSMKSPSMDRKHTKSSRSITFSATVSLFSDTQKRQNSLLFFDLWGVPATRARSDESMVSDVSGITQITDYQAPQSLSQLHQATASGVSDVFSGFKQSTMLSGPIFEDDEETWSDYELQHGTDKSDENSVISAQSGFSKYRKRKSTLTNDFVFGGRDTVASLKLID
eukprot:88161_1